MRPLGIKAFKTDSRTLKLARYMTPSLPAPPDSVKWSPAVSQWGMMLNGPSPDNPSFARDGLGCCTISSLGHAIQVWSANAYHQITLPDWDILVAYEQWCGYDPNDPATDRGGIELDVLNDWRQQGLAGHMLLGYADPNVANISEVRQAINLFGGVYIGMNLPITAESQIENGQPWDVTDSSLSGDAAPGSWGGHAVFVMDYDQDGFTCVTWGALQRMTLAFWNAYVVEAHALLGQDWLRAQGPKVSAPNGFDIDQLAADLAAID